jgi:uncharacterized protein (TIGR02588 family)
MPKRTKSEDEDAKRVLEAIAACVGAFLALATIGIIVWDGISADGTPPIVTVESGAVHAHTNGFVLEISASNSGDATAAEVAVEGTLSREGEIVETSETTFGYLPSGSRSHGGLFFQADPRAHDVAVRAKGYVDP